VLEVAKQLADHWELTALVVDDTCPKEGWREIAPILDFGVAPPPTTGACVQRRSRA